MQANIVGNQWKPGPITNAGFKGVGIFQDHVLRIYSADNRSANCPSGCTNDWDIGWDYWDGSSPERASWRIAMARGNFLLHAPYHHAAGCADDNDGDQHGRRDDARPRRA